MVVKPHIPHIAGFFVLGFIEQRLCGGQRITNISLGTAKRSEQDNDEDCGAGFYGLFFFLFKKLSTWAEAFF
jgi:hypothetical protein